MKQFGRLYEVISEQWFTEEPTRIVWFLRLLDAMDADGKVEMSRAKFGRLFNCTAKAAYYFLSCLEKRGIATLTTGTNSTQVEICHSDDYNSTGRNSGADRAQKCDCVSVDYVDEWRNQGAIKAQEEEQGRNLGVIRAQENTCHSDDYNSTGRNSGADRAQKCDCVSVDYVDEGRNQGAIKAQEEEQGRNLGVIRAQENTCHSDDYNSTGRNSGADRAQSKRKENRKESPLSPIPPITKEKIKEKKPLTRGYAPDFVGDVPSANAKEMEKQKKAAERKIRNEEKKQKQMTLVHKAREVFEKYYRELYEDSYYWDVKDAVAMKRLLQKIAFSRTNRTKPLPCDDDSLLEALDTFIRMIGKDWLMNNFSVCKIDSQYNEIVSEIKNKKNIQQNVQRNTKRQETSTALLAGQAAGLLNDIAKADELYYRGGYGGGQTEKGDPVVDNSSV